TGAAEALALERALLAWRRGDVARARAEAATVREPAVWTWAFEALAHATGAPALAAAPPLALAEADAACDGVALSRMCSVVGQAVRAEDLAARAAGRGTTCAGAAFAAETLASLGAASVEVAGDVALVRDTLARGFPALVRRIEHVGDRFVERPVVARGLDAATDLVVLDEADADRLDVM